MCAVKTKHEIHDKRHRRVRRKISGTSERPRLSVYKSSAQFYAQIIDDTLNHTLISASSLEKEFTKKMKTGSNKEAARLVGELLAARASSKGINSVVFDRGGFRFHGRIKEFAEAARKGGLQF